MTTRLAMDDNANGIKLENLYEFVSQHRLTPEQFKKLKYFKTMKQKTIRLV